MSPKLKPLLLPQLVEDRRKRESMAELDADFSSSSFHTQSSATSEIPSSPVTPTFSNRGHLRYSSSTSSIESPFYAESPSSPTFLPKTGKRSLPDVQEEPQDEKYDDFEMVDHGNDAYDFCDDQNCLHDDHAISQSSVQLSLKSEFDYDLVDGFFSDGDLDYASSRAKKRRVIESPMSGLASRFGTRFPSFSRKLRLKKPSPIYAPDAQQEYAISRAASSRSSSVSNSTRLPLDRPYEPFHMPPTPTKSVYESREDLTYLQPPIPIDIEKANRCAPSEEMEDNFASTPLLPPLMMDASANTNPISMQSPLQSPSVADQSDVFTGNVTPIDSVTVPFFPGMPSPPLSTKPSVSSFHRSMNRPSTLAPASEAPAILIAEENDEWSMKLGHANFTIHPEPYLPEVFDLVACRQLRANWDLARCNYTKHLVRTGEHYGTRSKTYELTQRKWEETEAMWKKNNDITIDRTVKSSSDPFATMEHRLMVDSGNENIMTKIPSLNDMRNGSKFPQMGDEDIVGPMVQVAAQLQRSPSKKTKIFKFFTQKFPASLGKS